MSSVVVHPPHRARVLVPVDFSACSHEVAAEAARLARGIGAEVVFLHVVATPGGLPGDVLVRPDPSGPTVSVKEWLEGEAARELPIYLRSMNMLGVPARTEVRLGTVTETILTAARELGARYIVMGTHGRTGLARMVLGSVAEEVLRQSICPVLTIRSIHRDDCAAGSCATCTSGRLNAIAQADAEGAG